MATLLFNSIVFGPVNSRRLGVSLGINLLPPDGKVCNFDCIYCECGFNTEGKTNTALPTAQEVHQALQTTLQAMQTEGKKLDVITFAGNGEPTLHPQFAGIVSDTIALRDQYYPSAKISVLSNSTTLGKKAVVEALLQVDQTILKIDTPYDYQLRLLNRPLSTSFDVKKLVSYLKAYPGKFIAQTMFVVGHYQGQVIDNTGEEEVEDWLSILEEIQPAQVMIYTIERETPSPSLHKVSSEKLYQIAEKVRQRGFDVQVST